MKNTLLFLFFLWFFTGCNHQKVTHQETVTSYYQARDTGDFEQLKTLVHDSITIISGDYVMPYNPTSFYEVFKWDSIFKPSYTLVDVEEQNDQVIASVAMSSLRNEFLKNELMTCQYEISFTAGNISRIKELDCKDVDWGVWAKERDSLVNWTKVHHPELDGFINDMTMNGALQYLKAIAFYKNRKDTL
ncbi:hypothetical protein [uncultured Dokdonia sp.]|uniref:hypothetical protein n=1 Tax=uncultured Dokdonia sp. TaxID=575653 RepID=UPI002625330C|nr:hypothetical protein [uncultured Dokdonia sp.]